MQNRKQFKQTPDIVHYFWIDILKIISILGVVIIHSNNYSNLNFVSYYFRFAVPVFIMVSFFITERQIFHKKLKLNIHFYYKKRIFRLFIPFLFWSFLYCLLNLKPDYTSLIKFITYHWIGYGWAGQYYLLLMIQLVLLYPFIHNLKITKKLIAITCSCLLIFYYLPLNYFHLTKIDLTIKGVFFLGWIPYCFIGIYAARMYDPLIKSLSKINPVIKFFIIFTSPLLIVLENFCLKKIFLINLTEVYFSMSVLIVSIIVFMLSINFKLKVSYFEKNNKNISELLFSLSSFTLGIFCLNPLIVDLLNELKLKLFSSTLNTHDAAIRLTLKVIFVYITALMVSFLIDKIGGTKLVK